MLPRDSLSIEQKADDKSHDYDASPLFRLPEQPEKLVTEKQKNLPVFFFFFRIVVLLVESSQKHFPPFVERVPYLLFNRVLFL